MNHSGIGEWAGENMITPVTVKCTQRVGPPTAEHACKQGPSLPTGGDLAWCRPRSKQGSGRYGALRPHATYGTHATNH